MKMQDIAKIGAKIGVKTGKMNKKELIRAIQRAEGNNDCFSTSQVKTCGQVACLWLEDCNK